MTLATRDRPERVETARDGREEPFLRLHVRSNRPEERWLRLIGAVGTAQALNGSVGLPAGFEQVMHPQALVPGPEIRVIAAPRAARIREDQDALLVIHEGGGFREVGRARPAFHDQAGGRALAFAHDAARAARHFRHEIGAEALDDLVERPRHRRQACQMLDQRIAAAHRLAAFHRLAIARDRARGEVAFAVSEWLIELHREGMGEVVQASLSWRDIHPHIVPLVRGDLRQAALHQRLTCRDDLDDSRMASREIGVDGGDQGGGFHRGQQMAEEPLLGGLESRAGGGLGLAVQRTAGFASNVGRFQRRGQVPMYDSEGERICIIDPALLQRKRMFQHLVFDAVIGQRARRVEAKRPQIAGQHLHRGNAASFDSLHKFRPRRKRKVLATPEPEALRIGEVVHRGCAGGRNIDHAGIRQLVLQTQARPALLRGRDLAALAFRSCGIGHGMAFVEEDHPVEIRPQPVDDLVDAGFSGPALL